MEISKESSMNQAKLPYLNKVIMVGSLVRDPELRYTTANVPVANFKIASNKRYRDNNGSIRDDVCYVGVVAWQSLAESCVEQLKKGHSVLVEGELKSRVRNDGNGGKKNFVEIRAHHIQFLSHCDDLVNLEEVGDSPVMMPVEDNDPGQPEEVMSTINAVEEKSGRSNYDYEENNL
jgi:single-strand DNA-binding protein